VYSKLLLEALDNPENIKVALLVGSEPSKGPVLGRRKREDINQQLTDENTRLRLGQFSTNIKAQTARRRRELNLELYAELHNEFSNFFNQVQVEEGVGNDEEAGVAEPTVDNTLSVTSYKNASL
jgi:hypothetical protein